MWCYNKKIYKPDNTYWHDFVNYLIDMDQAHTSFNDFQLLPGGNYCDHISEAETENFLKAFAYEFNIGSDLFNGECLFFEEYLYDRVMMVADDYDEWNISSLLLKAIEHEYKKSAENDNWVLDKNDLPNLTDLFFWDTDFTFFTPDVIDVNNFITNINKYKTYKISNLIHIENDDKIIDDLTVIKSTENTAQKDLSGFVYLIGCLETNFYKIGISKNPTDRLKTLQTSNPSPLELIVSVKSDNPKKHESILHELYKKYRGKGEWFKFDGDILGSCISRINSIG